MKNFSELPVPTDCLQLVKINPDYEKGLGTKCDFDGWTCGTPILPVDFYHLNNKNREFIKRGLILQGLPTDYYILYKESICERLNEFFKESGMFEQENKIVDIFKIGELRSKIRNHDLNGNSLTWTDYFLLFEKEIEHWNDLHDYLRSEYKKKTDKGEIFFEYFYGILEDVYEFVNNRGKREIYRRGECYCPLCEKERKKTKEERMREKEEKEKQEKCEKIERISEEIKRKEKEVRESLELIEMLTKKIA